MKRSILSVAAVASLVAIAFAAGRKAVPPEPTTSARDHAAMRTDDARLPPPTVVPTIAASSPDAKPSTPDARLSTLRDERDLASYLDDLDAAARREGKVTDELARGAAAGKKLEAVLGVPRTAMLMRDFGRRIERTRTELELKPTTDALATLAEKINNAPDDNTRRVLVSRYTQTAATLPQLYRLSAMDRLRESQPTALN